jgi:hypothetical protein
MAALVSTAGFADDLTASGSGRCDTANNCNGGGNTFADADGNLSNYAAENDTLGNLRNYFLFNLNGLGGVGNITSATLFIWNVPQANDPQIDFYSATDLTYTGLGNGSVVASGNVPASSDPGATTGYLSFTINSDGLAALNAAAISIDGDGNAYFAFGGDLPDSETRAFFNSFNSHDLPYLEYTTGDVTETPEPASLFLLGSGLLGAASTLRKRLVK